MVMLEEIEAIIRKNKLVKEEDVEDLAVDMHTWYMVHKRDMRMKEFRLLLAKYEGHRF